MFTRTSLIITKQLNRIYGRTSHDHGPKKLFHYKKKYTLTSKIYQNIQGNLKRKHWTLVLKVLYRNITIKTSFSDISGEQFLIRKFRCYLVRHLCEKISKTLLKDWTDFLQEYLGIIVDDPVCGRAQDWIAVEEICQVNG